MMVDIKIAKKTFQECIEKGSNKIRLEFPDSEWAPGVWAGCEGLQLEIWGHKWVVTEVFLNNKVICLVKMTEAKA